MNLRLRPVWILLMLLTLCAGLSPASATERRALLIGVSDYPREALENPLKDIALVGESLKGAGFAITPVANPTKGQFRTAVNKFAEELPSLPRDSLVFFYFSGHGFQASNKNWLMPRSSEIQGEADIDDQTVDAQWVLNRLHERAGSGVKIIFVLDACRDDPPVLLNGREKGLGELAEPAGGRETLIAFSASPGQTASDGSGRSGGPYAIALSGALSTFDIDIADVFSRVQRSFQSKGGTQRPTDKGFVGAVLKRSPTPEGISNLDRALTQASRQNRSEAGGGSRERPIVDADSGETRRKGPTKSFVSNDSAEFDTLKCLELVAPIGQKGLEDRAIATMNPTDLLCAAFPYVEGNKDANIEQNFDKAMYFTRFAAARGNSAAVNQLGLLLCCRAGGPKNDAEGYAWFRVAESMGNVRALRNIGVHYRDGIIVKQDYAEAERYFQSAAGRGDKGALRFLGYLYEDVKFPGTDKTKARDYFRQAFEADPTVADNVTAYAFSLRWGVKPDGSDADLKGAFDVYLTGAANGCRSCWSEAGQIADDTASGNGDPELAKELYSKGDAAGHAEASSYYGDILTRGRSKPEFNTANLKPAYEAHSRAAAQGFADSETKVALALAKGEGVARDPVRAAALIRSLLARDSNPDNAIRHAIYAPNYWGLGIELGNMIEDRLIAPRDAGELEALRARYGKRGEGMKRFTVPIQCGTINTTFHVYVINWDRPNDETSVDSQAEWVKHARGCTVGPDVLTSFTKLKAIARENQVAFTDLTVYALGAAQAEQAKEQKAKEDGTKAATNPS